MYKAVKGMNDIYGATGRKWSWMEDEIKMILRHFNYEEIRTPIVEELALFKRGVGDTTDVVQKEMYDFEDKKGRKLALRPEGTAGVVRAFIERKMELDRPLPLKVFYIGPNFRYERPQKGRYRQFYQLGLEVFGDPTPEMDAEVIFATSKIIERLKVHAEFHINSIGCSKCRPKYKEALLEFFGDKKDELCGDCQRRIETNPLRLLDCKKDDPRGKYDVIPMMTDHLCEECATDFERLKKALDTFHVEYKVDPFIVRGLDYYTKTAFEIVADTGGSQNSIGGGGRYNNLVEDMGGKPTPATGVAFGLERLFDLIPEGLRTEDSLVMGFTLFEGGVEDLVHFSKHISHHPVRFMADYVPRKMKNALKKANKLGVRHVFIFGEEEVKEKKMLYRDMETGEQTVYGQHEVFPIVKMLMDKEVETLSKKHKK